jgi:hypothetical protein
MHTAAKAGPTEVRDGRCHVPFSCTAKYRRLHARTMLTHTNPQPLRKAPVPSSTHARRGRHARRRKDKDKAKELPENPALHLWRPPRSKAIAPYTASSELEDSNLRSLIWHCRSSFYNQTTGSQTNELDVTVVTATTVTSPGPRFEWYPLCVRDEAFFHAVSK